MWGVKVSGFGQAMDCQGLGRGLGEWASRDHEEGALLKAESPKPMLVLLWRSCMGPGILEHPFSKPEWLCHCLRSSEFLSDVTSAS